MEEIWPQLKHWVEGDVPFAIATVVDATRPSPRGIGSVLAVRGDGEAFIGSVSAGCVETEVIEAAKACMQDSEVRWLTFGPESGFPWEVALSCGGRIKVRIERFAISQNDALKSSLSRHLDGKERGLLLSYGKAHCLIDASGEESGDQSSIPVGLLARARDHLKMGEETREVEWEDVTALFRILAAPKRLFVIGAAHIAIHLVGFARVLGFETIVIDPRKSYARADRFPSVPDELICDWPEAVLEGFELGAEDCVAAMTHDPKIDDQALASFLNSEAGYIGALGSRKSHDARLKRLRKSGFDDASLERIHAPIGLDIGSETPAEIALSVMAEVVKRKNSPRK